jgi:glycosyltransferase involved in cell wall biosynthesis
MILFFDQYPFIAGGQRILLNIAAAAQQVGLEISFAIPRHGALEAALRARFPGANVVDAPPPVMSHRRKNFLDALRLMIYTLSGILRHLQRARRARWLYANGGRQFLLVLALSLITRRPAIYHLHIDHSRIEKFLIRAAVRLSQRTQLVAISSFIRDRMVSYAPELAQDTRLALVENALSAEFAALLFQDRFHKVSPLKLAVTGTLRPEKGQDSAVALARRHPDIQMHLLGPTGDGAEDWVRRLQVAAPSNVVFHGPVQDVPTTIARLGVHVNLVPSRWKEPFGLAAIEGMACSCITLVSPNGALPEIAARTGALVHENDAMLDKQLEDFKASSLETLVQIARAQFDRTKREYAPERFDRQIQALLTA